MPVPFPEQRDQIRQIAAMILRRDPADWPQSWDLLLDHTRQMAWQDILTSLTARGYSPQQIERWDNCAEFLRDLTLFWLLTLAAAFTQVSESLLRRLDRRQELQTVHLTLRGQCEAPTSPAIRVGQ